MTETLEDLSPFDESSLSSSPFSDFTNDQSLSSSPFPEFTNDQSLSSSTFFDFTNDQSLSPLITSNDLGLGSTPSNFFSAALNMPDDDTSAAPLFGGGDETFSSPDYTAFLQDEDETWGGKEEEVAGQADIALGDDFGADLDFGNDMFSGQIFAMGDDDEMLFQA